jgi:hypothetical protein
LGAKTIDAGQTIVFDLHKLRDEQKFSVRPPPGSAKEEKSFRSYRKPQPWGLWNDPTRECRCTPLQIQHYVGRISGPLLDRIDIHIDVPAVRFRARPGEDDVAAAAVA